LILVGLFFIQSTQGISLGTGIPIPLNNGFPSLLENPVFLFACCILNQQGLDGCVPDYCTGGDVATKVGAMNTALQHPRNEHPADEVKREMKGLIKHPHHGGALLEMRERLHDLKAKSHRHTHQKDKTPYTTNLWPDGNVYLELDADLFTRFVSVDEHAIWLVVWIMKAISEYEGHTCLKIYLLPPVSFLEPFVGLMGFTLPHRTMIHMHPQDEAWTVGLGHGASAIHFSQSEARVGVEHELGHMLGMHHTQIRDDRDNFVTYDEPACRASYTPACSIAFGVSGSIRDAAAQTTEQCVASWVAQYTKDSSLTSTGVDVYNYGSIMHYPFDSCISAIPAQLAAFSARAGSPPSVPYVNNITPLDYEQLRMMYHCPAPNAENPLISLGRTIIETVSNALSP
jgi:hypothetical protein